EEKQGKGENCFHGDMNWIVSTWTRWLSSHSRAAARYVFRALNSPAAPRARSVWSAGACSRFRSLHPHDSAGKPDALQTLRAHRRRRLSEVPNTYGRVLLPSLPNCIAEI